MRKDQAFGVRLNAEERNKLLRLAATTDRTPSEVMRLLLRQAKATGQPDIILAPGREPSQGVRT